MARKRGKNNRLEDAMLSASEVEESTFVEDEEAPEASETVESPEASETVETLEYAVEEAVEEEAAPTSVDESPTVPERVQVVNRLRQTVYVPTRFGALRLGPRASEVVATEDVTEGTRRLENAGRIHIRNL